MNVATQNPPAAAQERKSRMTLSISPDKEFKPGGPILTEADADVIKAFAGKGMSGFARQGDLVELHKRIAEKFGTLPKEFSAHTDQAHKAIQSRLETLEGGLGKVETSLNGLEAALRIELAPALSAVITQTLAEQTPKPRGGLRRGVGFLLIAGASLAVGAYFHAELNALWREAQTALAAYLPK